MKLEFDITDITREDLVNAMATKLLGAYVDSGDKYNPVKELAEVMHKMLEDRIGELANEAVRRCFDESIHFSIRQAVDEVLADGWQRTDSYGNAIGERVDLKGRISEVITEKKNEWNKPPTVLAERLVLAKVEEVFRGEFDKEIQAARAKLREQLDEVVKARFVETLKQSLGLR